MNSNERLKVKSMGVGEVSRLLDSMCWQKVHQGDAVRVAPIDYNALMLDELEQIEKFSPNCKDELKCLSYCIRRYLWKNNTEKLWELIAQLNILTKVLAEIFSPEEYWNQDTIIDYVKHLYSKRSFIGVADEEIYGRIIDFVQIAGAKSIIDEKWSEVLKADDGSRTFIELFDDIFTNAIEKYEAEFIHSLVDTDVLYRMVTETICNEDRFIPWPNKVQNRWNPPGKTYLYLSYGTEDIDYNTELKVGQYICLLECKLKNEADTCFCRFKPVKSGRILDLSYNDIELYSIRRVLENQANNHVSSMLDLLLSDADLIRHRDDQGYVRRRIEQTMEAHPLDRSLIEKNSVKQILKLICSCIYKKLMKMMLMVKKKPINLFKFWLNILREKESRALSIHVRELIE